MGCARSRTSGKFAQHAANVQERSTAGQVGCHTCDTSANALGCGNGNRLLPVVSVHIKDLPPKCSTLACMLNSLLRAQWRHDGKQLHTEIRS